MRLRYLLLALATIAPALAAAPAAAQTRDDLPDFLFDPFYYSRRDYEKKGVMSGNEVGITAFNYGLLGGVGEIRGNWPRGSNDFYVGDVLPVVAVEVPVDSDGDGTPDTIARHVLTSRGPGNRGIPGPPGQSVAWTLEAKPGFASDRVREDTDEPNDNIAFSTDPATWPDFWPDEPTWLNPGTGRAQWNGYFGRNQFSADLETYFWADDQNFLAPQVRNNFVPDSTRAGRNGLGLDLKVRGLQWSQFLAQDAIFWLYEVTNTSTTTYDRVAVGLTVGTAAGGDGDTQDDLAFFDQANRIVYSWDFDNSGNQGQPVGYVGYGFLESPGNSENGIDDDCDADPTVTLELCRDADGLPYVDLALVGQGNVFLESDFQPRLLAAGDPLVLIDAVTGERSVVYVPASGTVTVVSQGIPYEVAAGQVREETQQTIVGQAGGEVIVTAKNLIDEDLDGLIDEDTGLHFERRAQAFTGEIIVLPALRYRNYVGFYSDVAGRTPTRADSVTHGLLNPMIDEDRANGIDEDGDWDPLRDDVGRDGQAGTGDEGEGNGVPDDGEPNFDRLDVTESDQVGLSSFFYFAPSNAFPLSEPNRVWEGMTPGFFTTNEELAGQQSGGGVDGDFVFGSGYFRLRPGETLRFTLALVFGQDLQDITTNTITIQEIYNRNYQFARPPDRPSLNAVPGDHRVTLYWDAIAEASVDPILGEDFEGYRLFRSTDPFFRDVEWVTDVNGNDAVRVPIAQFDRNNGIRGTYTSADPRVRGVPFNLGTDSGLRYSFVDSTVTNGQRYYYALTAYDHGSPDFFPAENDIPVSVREDGTVITGANVVEVMPNAPVAGYRAGSVVGTVQHVAGPATGEVFAETLDPEMLQEGAAYHVSFSTDEPAADSFFVSRSGTPVGAGRLSEAASTIFDGLRLAFNNDATRIDEDSTGYFDPTGLVALRAVRVNEPSSQFFGQDVPYDYEVRFSDQLVGESIATRLGPTGPEVPARAVNFTVWNTTLGRPAEFAFRALDGNDGYFSYSLLGIPPNVFRTGDVIYLFETVGGERVPTYVVRFDANEGDEPSVGDVFNVVTRKPFSSRDAFSFTTTSSLVDNDAAREQMDAIRVVPNPYVAAASWERPLPPTVTSGRGERRVDFIHLPAGSRVRIFDVRGALIRELVHDSPIDDGTVTWDLRTRENLETAYGVYFYHVDAPGVGERTGRLALIK